MNENRVTAALALSGGSGVAGGEIGLTATIAGGAAGCCPETAIPDPIAAMIASLRTGRW
jgi:hypothetical protein